MNKEIFDRAYEMISNGYEFGQIQNGDAWEHLLQGGPYSDMYTCAEKLVEEFSIDINLAMKYLKAAFDKYEPMNNELYETRNMKKTIKLNESQLRKVVVESVRKVLKEEYAGTDWLDDNPNKGMFSQEFENTIDAVHKALKSFIDARSKELEVNRNTDARRDIEHMTNAVIKCMTTFDMYVPGIRTC